MKYLSILIAILICHVAAAQPRLNINGPDHANFKAPIKKAKIYLLDANGITNGNYSIVNQEHGENQYIGKYTYTSATSYNRDDEWMDATTFMKREKAKYAAVLENKLSDQDMQSSYYLSDDRLDVTETIKRRDSKKIYNAKYTYDDDGRIIEEIVTKQGAPDIIRNCIYNEDANSMTIISAFVKTGEIHKVSTYHYNENGDPAKLECKYPMHKKTPNKVHTTVYKYTYDNKGNYTKVATYKHNKLSHTVIREITY